MTVDERFEADANRVRPALDDAIIDETIDLAHEGVVEASDELSHVVEASWPHGAV